MSTVVILLALLIASAGCSHRQPTALVIDPAEHITRVEQGQTIIAPENGYFIDDALFTDILQTIRGLQEQIADQEMDYSGAL